MTDVNLEAAHMGLKATKLLRCGMRDLFKTLADGPSASGDDEDGEKTLQNDIQTVINNINHRMRDLESACTLLAQPNPPSGPLPLMLGNTSLLGHDTSWERTPLYNSLISAYRWSDRVFEHSSQLVQMMNSNLLKKTASQFHGGGLRGRPYSVIPLKKPTMTAQQFDNFCSVLQRQFNDMQIEIHRPFGAPAVLKVTLERVLKSVIVLRGPSIEWVLVKGFHEDFFTEDGKIDIWTPSRYHVFQKITDNANAAMLHFFHTLHPDLAVKSYVTWLHSYNNLFNKPCKRCDRRLQNNLPPTWRDVRNLDVYHEQCRP